MDTHRYDKGARYRGKCTHGYVFYDTSCGIATKCPKCLDRGKVTGYWAQRRAGKLKKVM